MCSLSHRFNQRMRRFCTSQQNLWNISTALISLLRSPFCLHYHPTKPACMEEVLWTIINLSVDIRHPQSPVTNLLIQHTLSQQICYSLQLQSHFTSQLSLWFSDHLLLSSPLDCFFLTFKDVYSFCGSAEALWCKSLICFVSFAYCFIVSCFYLQLWLEIEVHLIILCHLILIRFLNELFLCHHIVCSALILLCVN